MDKKKRIGIVFGALALIFAVYFGYKHFVYVETDNAQVSAHTLMISSRVNGTIQKVLVDENQKVKKGDVLAQVDTSDYSTANEAAESQVAALQARYREAQLAYERAATLVKSQAISQERYDAALAAYRDVQARLNQAKAQQEQAQLNVNYTRIVAPADGVISRRSVEPGQFVAAGQPLFGFVGSNERWVTANLKETELGRVAPGRPVSIDVDALPGRDFRGEVQSIAPSTGAMFTLLPPDNATGNFTKVVQRVPVRIRFMGLSPQDIDDLHAGLSAVVRIRIR